MSSSPQKPKLTVQQAKRELEKQENLARMKRRGWIVGGPR